MVEHGTRKCAVYSVPDRRAATLIPVIQSTILPGSHIMSDGWNAYANLDTIDHGIYLHSVVIHAENFVNPIDQDVHTQSIESVWCRAKKNYDVNVEQVMICFHLT